MVVGDHRRAGHPRPRRAALPGSRRRRRHVQVQPPLPQLPQRGQPPVHVCGVPHPVRPRRRPREPHRRTRHRVTVGHFPPAQHRFPGRLPQPSSSTLTSAASASASAHSTRAGSHPLAPTGRTRTRPPALGTAGAITWRAVSTNRSPAGTPSQSPRHLGLPCQLTDSGPVNTHGACLLGLVRRAGWPVLEAAARSRHHRSVCVRGSAQALHPGTFGIFTRHEHHLLHLTGW